jgi:2-oxo-4-hydroxy-4-carboxy-5-ureidoimidazoline decarboxylase
MRSLRSPGRLQFTIQDRVSGYAERTPVDLATWNALPSGEAERELLTCCASPRWAAAVTAGRPYAGADTVLTAARAALDGLDWTDVQAALDAHPRIGERVSAAGREADWSRREQAGAQDTDAATAAALVEANVAYEERFGHVFLIFATGKSAGEMLAAARERLANDQETERSVVRRELAKITRLRMERLLT